LAGLAHEIIVIDGMSSDRTVKIASKYADKVIKRRWDNYSNQKNFGIRKAKNRWILSIDADERVSKELAAEIKCLEFDKDGYLLPIKNFFLGRWLKHGGQYPDYHLRLFKKNKGSFKFGIRQVHEGVVLKSESTGYLKGPLLHYSYRDIETYFDKFNKYTDLDALGRFKNGKKPSVYGLFIRPVHRFIKWYIIKAGFLDGMNGFLFHLFSAVYYFTAELKLYEKYGYRKGVLVWRD
jgi:glycosyltransferase involved in cell wall biosynthesis